MNVLITGGAGFVGSHTADKLIAKGHKVRILDNLEKQVHDGIIPSYLNNQCEFINGDVRNIEDVKKALNNIEYVFHFAARVGVGQSMYEVSDFISSACVGTANLFDVIINDKLKIKKIILASSMSNYGEGSYLCPRCSNEFYPKKRLETSFNFHCPQCHNEDLEVLRIKESRDLNPTSIYALAKKNQEEYSLMLGETYNIPVIAFRYWNIYGTRQALSNPYTGVSAIFSSCLLNDNSPTIYEDGNQTRDFIHIKDVVEANYLAMTSKLEGTHCFNIASGHIVSVKEVAEILAKQMGKNIKPNITNKLRIGDVRNCVPDISKARKILGFNPEYDFEKGSQDLIDWVKKQRSFDKMSEVDKKLKQFQLLK